MIVVALNILFRAASQKNTRLQNVIGIYLHANGVKDSVITQLNRMGISASLRSIDRILEALTVIAKANIVAAGEVLFGDQYTLCMTASSSISALDRSALIVTTLSFVARRAFGRNRPLR